MIFAQSANNWFGRLLRARLPRRVEQRLEQAPPRLAIVGSERWLLDVAVKRLAPLKDEQPKQDELIEISQVRVRPTFAVGASSPSSWPGSRFIVVRFLPSKVWLAVAVAILTTTPAAASAMLTAELATTTPPATRVADHPCQRRPRELGRSTHSVPSRARQPRILKGRYGRLLFSSKRLARNSAISPAPTTMAPVAARAAPPPMLEEPQCLA
jgi:hypothetical protein